jgi:class I fructose-bisphosphate aldolase
MDADQAISKVDLCMRSGAAGIIFGRNLWQRPYDEALALSRRVHDVMARYPA